MKTFRNVLMSLVVMALLMFTSVFVSGSPPGNTDQQIAVTAPATINTSIFSEAFADNTREAASAQTESERYTYNKTIFETSDNGLRPEIVIRA